jgi:hypothetical protein
LSPESVRRLLLGGIRCFTEFLLTTVSESEEISGVSIRGAENSWMRLSVVSHSKMLCRQVSQEVERGRGEGVQDLDPSSDPICM